MLERRLAAGERIIGKKIGLTSKAVQTMLGVNQPDFGYLTDAMVFSSGAVMPISDRLIQPKAEGEIAFVLKRDLQGPGVTNADVLAATEGVMACFEIVDSRIRDWKIKIQDTVADNASGAAFVLGAKLTPLAGMDLRYVGYVMMKNGQLATSAAGAAVLGSPAQAVAWLANKLGEYGITLKAGEIILSGSAGAAVPVQAGDSVQITLEAQIMPTGG